VETDLAELEEMAARLEASGFYRVLRRLDAHAASRAAPSGATRIGLFVDVETTGLDPARDEIIELAMAPFTYDLNGEVTRIGEAFCALREPSIPITAQITSLTGITQEMVAGQVIDPDQVAAFAAPAAIVIAHNAAFDRRFLERFCQTFTTKPWACSMSQVDWALEGHEGARLAHLAAGAGFFYDKHRALNDCHAGIELLARTMKTSGKPALAQLLDAARRPSWRIWAENSPFELKDVLKMRGYRWNAEHSSGPRAWYVDVGDVEREAELAFLRQEIYQRDIDLACRRIDAHDRFSDRV
jgi:DNA polymerase-3 subunit epsilon